MMSVTGNEYTKERASRPIVVVYKNVIESIGSRVRPVAS